MMLVHPNIFTALKLIASHRSVACFPNLFFQVFALTLDIPGQRLFTAFSHVMSLIRLCSVYYYYYYNYCCCWVVSTIIATTNAAAVTTSSITLTLNNKKDHNNNRYSITENCDNSDIINSHNNYYAYRCNDNNVG